VGEAVYDPFAGSGTTLIAAEQEGRRCFAVEIEPKYCDIILARWEKATGKAARRIESASRVLQPDWHESASRVLPPNWLGGVTA
jgi:DNA modification methylase